MKLRSYYTSHPLRLLRRHLPLSSKGRLSPADASGCAAVSETVQGPAEGLPPAVRLAGGIDASARESFWAKCFDGDPSAYPSFQWRMVPSGWKPSLAYTGSPIAEA